MNLKERIHDLQDHLKVYFDEPVSPRNQQIIVLRKVTCAQGHTFIINPRFVLSPIPCDYGMFCTDEVPDFLFYGEGKTKEQVARSIGNKVCHYWHLYNGLEEEVLDEFDQLQEIKDSFNERVKKVDANEN